MNRNPSKRLILFTAVWVLGVSAGMATVWNYAQTPGIGGNPTLQWPYDTQIQRTPGRATLVMLAHPQCPCTRASIRELALLMARCQGLLTAHVLFFKPKGFAEGWEQTDLWRDAAAIPGVEVKCDIDGVEARRFHAATSGQTVVYDAEGRLLFSGGITGARGHSGDNAGRSAIVSLLTRGVAERGTSPVFGCSLLAPYPN